MKKLILCLILFPILTISLSAGDQNKVNDENRKVSNTYKRYFESAHPLPDPKMMIKEYMIPLTNGNVPSVFLNVNTVDDKDDPNPMQNESSIAVNPLNPKNLIASAVDYRGESSAWIYVSSDGGVTWTNRNLGKPYSHWRSSNDPSVIFDAEGTGYYVYGGFGNTKNDSLLFGENGVFLARSFDEGKTWEPHNVVIIHEGEQTLDSTFEDKYYIHADKSPSSPYFGHLYIPWKRVTPRDSATQIVISKSTDRGGTWSIPVNVSHRLSGSSEDTTFGQSFPLAITGPDGDVYVVWNHGIEHGVGFARSTDGGATFSEPRIIHNYNIFGTTTLLNDSYYRHTVKGRVRAEAYPVIVCDYTDGPGSGNIYLCWAADNIPNIYFSRSLDKGDTWSDPVIVHSDTENDQFWPWLSMDPTNGDLAIMYFDSRNDPENIMVECFVSYSNDGGLTWIDRQVADEGSDLRLNPFQGNVFAGDYSGSAFYNGVVYPSWVDMRSAVSNIADSDVFTAIVNTRAPNPPENFKAIIIPDRPKELQLSWEIPDERAFGQAMEPSEFNLRLFRDGVFLTDIPSSSDSYTDTELTPYEEYSYRIMTVAGSDTSIKREASSFAGGAKYPAPPTILSATGNHGNDVSLSIQLPSLRADLVTPLSRLDKIDIYRDGTFLKTVELTPEDTGSVINIDDNAPAQGYYRYQAKVFDRYDDGGIDPQESEFGNDILVYTGPVGTVLTENFDSPPLVNYCVSGSWQVSDEFSYSQPNCFTESPGGDYRDGANDTLMLFPVETNGKDAIRLDFVHAAIVDKRDSAFVEYSFDHMKSWRELAHFNLKQYNPWDDGLLNSDDWKEESLLVRGLSGDTVYLRFRFYSNMFKSEDGWYIDDIAVESLSSVDNSGISDNSIIIYPNPAINILNIKPEFTNSAYIDRYEILNAYGAMVTDIAASATFKGDAFSKDISGLSSGVYIIRIVMSDRQVISKRFTVIK